MYLALDAFEDPDGDIKSIATRTKNNVSQKNVHLSEVQTTEPSESASSTSEPPGVLQTTCIFPNRIRDMNRVRSTLGLEEFGNPETEFSYIGDRYSGEALRFAKGYMRVVYGDHGPYIEFVDDQIIWSAFPHWRIKQHPQAYYDEIFSKNKHLMLYAQRRAVSDKPNPPYGPWSHNNFRPEGYADYMPGRYYVACDVSVIRVLSPHKTDDGIRV
eukprot:GEMP01067913.1.p1 GENE.GEMP01067913.1~~GEMP01067913.1.p1  ORF type:complete len:214 (+),score=25.78 GEMP01067913.1:84-725(+)